MSDAQIFQEILSAEDLQQYDKHIDAAFAVMLLMPNLQKAEQFASAQTTTALRVALKYQDKDPRILPAVINILTPFVTAPAITPTAHPEAFQLAAELGIAFSQSVH